MLRACRGTINLARRGTAEPAFRGISKFTTKINIPLVPGHRCAFVRDFSRSNDTTIKYNYRAPKLHQINGTLPLGRAQKKEKEKLRPRVLRFEPVPRTRITMQWFRGAGKFFSNCRYKRIQQWINNIIMYSI